MSEKITATVVSVTCGGTCAVVEYIEAHTGAHRCATIGDFTTGRTGLINKLGGKLKEKAVVIIYETELVHGERRILRVG